MKSNAFKLEPRELREPTNDDKASEGSDRVPNDIKKGNLITFVEDFKSSPRIRDLQIIRPCYQSHPNGIVINGEQRQPGVYWHGLNDDNDVDEWICSPLTIEAITSSPTGEDYGSLLKFTNIDGKSCEWPMPRRMLKSRSGEELLGELLDRGFKYNPKKRNNVVEYIMSTIPSKRITAVGRVGWHTNEAFVFPHRVIGNGNVVFQAETVIESGFSEMGTLKGWQDNIGKFCVGNIPLILSVCAPLAGSLLMPLNRHQGGAIHLVGDSSIGKTTGAYVSASTLGSADLLRSWSATANGLEGVALTRNDTCLILDEISEAHPEEISKIIYVLLNGQGKQRASQKGHARKIHRWRTFAISTGEQTLSGKMGEIGKRPQVGQEVRLLSINAKFEYGIFSNLHGFETGRQLSDHLKESCSQHYGHIGPAFIAHLINEKRNLPDLYHGILQAISKNLTCSIDQRAASTFSIMALAGELGIEYGLLPWPQGSALDAILIAFNRWRESQDEDRTEDERILQSIRNFIAKHGDSRFSDTTDDRPIINRAGWFKQSDQDLVYMFNPTALDEAGGGFNRKRIIDALDKACWIVNKDKDRFTTKTSIKSRKISLYHICEKTED